MTPLVTAASRKWQKAHAVLRPVRRSSLIFICSEADFRGRGVAAGVVRRSRAKGGGGLWGEAAEIGAGARQQNVDLVSDLEHQTRFRFILLRETDVFSPVQLTGEFKLLQQGPRRVARAHVRAARDRLWHGSLPPASRHADLWDADREGVIRACGRRAAPAHGEAAGEQST